MDRLLPGFLPPDLPPPDFLGCPTLLPGHFAVGSTYTQSKNRMRGTPSEEEGGDMIGMERDHQEAGVGVAECSALLREAVSVPLHVAGVRAPVEAECRELRGVGGVGLQARSPVGARRHSRCWALVVGHSSNGP